MIIHKLEILETRWNKIQKLASKIAIPKVLYKRKDFIYKILRDSYTHSISQLNLISYRNNSQLNQSLKLNRLIASLLKPKIKLPL